MDFKKPLFTACICVDIYTQIIPCHKPNCPLYKLDDLPSNDFKINSNFGTQTITASEVSASTVAYGTLIKI